jgi:RNA polymerase sigma factor (sigma-70 family)
VAAQMDRNFLDDLYRRYSGSVFRRACLLMDDRDAGQDVFLRAFEARVEFTAAPSSLGWLYRVTTNLSLNRLRDARRRRELLKRTWNSESATRPTTETALIVRALLDQVPEDIQEMAVHYFVDQMSQDEIALLMSVPRRTIGYRLEQFRVKVLAVARDERGELAR